MMNMEIAYSDLKKNLFAYCLSILCLAFGGLFATHFWIYQLIQGEVIPGMTALAGIQRSSDAISDVYRTNLHSSNIAIKSRIADLQHDLTEHIALFTQTASNKESESDFVVEIKNANHEIRQTGDRTIQLRHRLSAANDSFAKAEVDVSTELRKLTATYIAVIKRGDGGQTDARLDMIDRLHALGISILEYDKNLHRHLMTPHPNSDADGIISELHENITKLVDDITKINAQLSVPTIGKLKRMTANFLSAGSQVLKAGIDSHENSHALDRITSELSTVLHASHGVVHKEASTVFDNAFMAGYVLILVLVAAMIILILKAIRRFQDTFDALNMVIAAEPEPNGMVSHTHASVAHSPT